MQENDSSTEGDYSLESSYDSEIAALHSVEGAKEEFKQDFISINLKSNSKINKLSRDSNEA